MTVPLGQMRIADGIHASAARAPQSLAVRCGDRELVYGQLDDRVRRVSRAATRDLQLAVGDRVAILAPNCLEYPEIICGLTDVGAIVATLNPRGNAGEVAASCRDSGARAIFVHGSLEKVARDAVAATTGVKTVERIIVLGPEYERWLTAVDMAGPFALPDFDDTQPFSLVYSSGTTGEPKGILLSHRSRVLTFQAMAAEYGCFGPHDRFYALAPLAHGAGFAFAMAGLFFGGFVEIESKFEPTLLLQRLADGRFNGVFMVPTHFQALFSLPVETLDKYRGHATALRAIISNAAALPQRLKQYIVEYFGPQLLHESYGSTEAGIVSNLRPADQLRTQQSVGRAFAANEIRLLDDAGQVVANGEIGELYSRSPYLFSGYWNKPQATEDCGRAEGWVSAGDLARFDEQGFLYIVDRKKDMVISGGINIYPKEIEIALERHPEVAEASVVGVPDVRWGERLRAFVVLKPQADPSSALAAEILEFCRGQLSSYKAPRELGFLAAIPRNATGKVLKRELRAGGGMAVAVHTYEPEIHKHA